MAAPEAGFQELGPNSGLIEEMYRQFVENPESVAESWREFFADYVPRGHTTSGDGNGEVATTAAPAPPPAPAAPAPPEPAPKLGVPIPAEPATPEPLVAPHEAAPPLVLDGEEPKPLRGAAARIVENMEASLTVPTATSVRVVPAKLLEVNRQILNNHLARVGGGKVSFTHLIAFAIVRAIARMPAMSSGFGVVDGKPAVVRHDHVNLGLAVDVEKSDGSRSLMVPNIKHADELDFAAFFAAYEELIRKVRSGQIEVDDFAGTTASITNPGMIGTVSSVPRLMPGQGFIVGVGAIGFPAEYEGADAHVLAQLGVSRVVTLTSTYDHRVIQGAESGE
ncbi:MAG TPA: 2-oxo acid dehydrogenase subunit E2, partial [Acidimicrobiia bacterium]